MKLHDEQPSGKQKAENRFQDKNGQTMSNDTARKGGKRQSNWSDCLKSDTSAEDCNK